MGKIDFAFASFLVLIVIVAGFVGGSAIAAETAQEPTPYITATAPMPGDPPPSQDWLETRDARFHKDPYPAPFETPTPYAYPGSTAEQADSFEPSDAGLWAFIWDWLTWD